jgi:actin-related protein
MTEEQRMEEGRRMFQIFAARMFEQRVLTAWKEKQAIERRQALLDEETNAELAEEQKKAKKAKEALKKKEKAQQKKAALAEEKRKKDEAKAAEEAKLREVEEKKAEQARLKNEEKRKKREAQKKAEEEERFRKEAEKQRQLQEQRDRQAKQEKRLREAKERERKEKEEQRLKEKEAKDAKEKEARERKERQEIDRRESEAKIKAEKDAKDPLKRDDPAIHHLAVIPQVVKRPQQSTSVPVTTSVHAIAPIVPPHVPVATPVLPKAPTPIRPTTTSQKDAGSIPQTPQVGKSQSSSPNPSTPLKSSPDSSGIRAPPFLHHPQATSPIHSALKGPPGGFQPSSFAGMQPMGMNGFPAGMPMAGPGFGQRMHHENMFQPQQPIGNQFRPLSGPNGIPMPPGMNGMPMQQGRGFPTQHPPPGFPAQLPNGPLTGMGQPFAGHKEAIQTHSRQQSASYDKSGFEGAVPATQPIGRPSAIARPSSVVHGLRSPDNDLGEVINQLGSASLLDDSDEPLNTAASNTGRRSSAALGMGRQPYQQLPQVGPGMNMEPYGFANPHSYANTWGPPHPFTTSSLPGPSLMGGWANQPQGTFGAVGGAPGRPSMPRNTAIRQILCQASKALAATSADGWINIHAVQREVEAQNGHRDEGVTTNELLVLCDTEGNPNNGGGFFDVRENDGATFIRYQPDAQSSNHRQIGAPGEIGSPITGPTSRFGPPGGIPGIPGGF